MAPISSTDMEWQRSAACVGKDAELWFPEDRTSVEAKQICNACPVKTECLRYSVITEQQWGLWGGVGQHRRREMILKRPQHVRFDRSTR